MEISAIDFANRAMIALDITIAVQQVNFNVCPAGWGSFALNPSAVQDAVESMAIVNNRINVAANMVGLDRIASNVNDIPAVCMDLAISHGNVVANPVGVDCCAIKISTIVELISHVKTAVLVKTADPAPTNVAVPTVSSAKTAKLN